MRRFVRTAATLAASAALSCAPALVWASGGGAEGEPANPWLGLGFKCLNLAILLGGLAYFLRKTIAQGLLDRQEAVRRALDEARKAKEDAEAKSAEYRRRIAGLDDEVRRVREEFKAEGERQRQRILDEAQRQAEAIRLHAEDAGNREVKRARDELRADLAEMAVRLAEQLLARAYGPDDQKKAVRETIQSVGRVH